MAPMAFITHLSPAAYVIHCFGGVRKTGRLLGRTGSTISQWTKEKKDGRGRGGQVPNSLHKKILHLATTRGLDITPNDLIFGRTVGAARTKPGATLLTESAEAV